MALSEATINVLITGTVTVITGACTTYFAYKAKQIGQATNDAVNGKMHEMLQLAQSLSRAEGKLEGMSEAEKKVALESAAKAEGQLAAAAAAVKKE